MMGAWWIDAFLVFFLSILVIAIYKLTVREFSLRPNGGIDSDKWQMIESNTNRFYPAKMIRSAGFIPTDVSYGYWISKIVISVLLPLIYLEFMRSDASYWYVLLGGVAGFFSVDLILYSRSKRRKQQVQRSVSYFVDLLVAFLKAGLNLPEAFDRIAARGLQKESPLAKEVELLAMEVDAGLAWQSAFEKLGKRTGSKELERLALLMRIGKSTGAPMLASLSGYAELLREAQVEKVNELLNRKTLETLIPTLLLSMPVFLVLVFFPTGVQIFEAFQLFSSTW